MNWAFELSLRVEELLSELEEQEKPVTSLDRQALYDAALAQAVKETQGKAWATGNIRM